MDDYSKYSNKAPWSSYHDAVAWAAGRGITLGTAPGYFAPFDFCSRAQIITFFWRAAGSPEPSSSGTPFTDVTDSSAYYYKPVLWAVETGLTNGVSETNFGTNKICTRAEIVTFLWRLAESPTPETESNPFSDVESDCFYSTAVQWAVQNHVTLGTSPTTFSPEQNCSRAETVSFLFRALEQ